MSLLVTGTIGIDTIETPFGRADKVLGGSAVYFSLAASHHTDVNMVSVAGEDLPNGALKPLEAQGVGMDGIEIVEGGKTFAWHGKYHLDLNHRDTIGTWLNTLEGFDPKVPEAARDAPFVFLANLAPPLQMQVLDQMNDTRFVALDTMNFWIESDLDGLKEVLGRVDCVIINDEEARELTEQPNLVKAASAIQALGPDTVVIKKGEHGALLFHEGSIFAAPGLPLEEVVDPTGAGDTFAGGFMGTLAAADDTSLETMRRAVVNGSALASICVEQFGTEALHDIPASELKDRVDAFRRLVEH